MNTEKRPDTQTVSTVRFLFEQNGAPERDLKERLVAVLGASRTIERAFLARVDYGSPESETVALCLLAAESDDSLLQQVNSVFSSMFGRDQHLDVMYITEEQYRDLINVCRPFFRGPTDEKT